MQEDGLVPAEVCEAQIGIVRPKVECISGRQSYLGALRQVIGVLGEPEEQEVDRAEWEIPLYGGITCSVDVNLDDDGNEIVSSDNQGERLAIIKMSE